MEKKETGTLNGAVGTSAGTRVNLKEKAKGMKVTRGEQTPKSVE